jgi:hypothetical protein
MKIYSAALIGAAMLGAIAASPANAVTADPGLRAPTAVENVACRTVRSTKWRHGRRVTTRRTVCDPRCRTVRERVWHRGHRVWRTREVCRRW